MLITIQEEEEIDVRFLLLTLMNKNKMLKDNNIENERQMHCIFYYNKNAGTHSQQCVNEYRFL